MTKDTDEESITNIANFIEATKPVQDEGNSDEVSVKQAKQGTKEGQEAKNLVMLGNKNLGVRKLPSSVEAKPIRPKQGTPQNLSQIGKSKLGSGVSITKLKPPDLTSAGNHQVRLPSSVSFTRMEAKHPVPATAAPVATAGVAVSISKQVELTKMPSSDSSEPANINKFSQRVAITKLPSQATPPVSQTQRVSLTKISSEVSKPECAVATKLSSADSQFAPPQPQNSVSVSQLLEVTRKLEENSALHSQVAQYMTSDGVRNLCDGTTALQLSGETHCSDVDTLSLYQMALNITDLKDQLKHYEKEEFTPLTNLACRTSYCKNLQTLVDKEPNLRGFISNKIGDDELRKFDTLVNFHSGQGNLFVVKDVELCVGLYHKIRNISLKYVLTKLRNVYLKMKPMFNALVVKNAEFNSCVSRLATLVNSDWEKEVRISEDTAYDFDFLFTILKYVKKVRDQPESVTPTDNKPTSEKGGEEQSQSKTESKTDDNVVERSQTPEVSPTSMESPAESVSPTQVTTLKPETKEKDKNLEESLASDAPAPTEVVKQSTGMDNTAVSEVGNERVKRIIISKPRISHSQPRPSSISVGSLHQLKSLLEQSEEPRQRVIRGVGEQAYKEFLNLVSSLKDQSLLIEDFNIRTLYFTILNFSHYPLTPEMKNLEPLSNFSLRLQPFVDLKNLFEKDGNIKKMVSVKLGSNDLTDFENHVEGLAASETDFIMKEQEKNICLYHKVRNCVAESLITRLRGIHAKIANIQVNSAPERFSISIRMLQSLMDSQFNGQVLMMEKSRFNFDFLSTILEYLQQFNPGQLSQVKTSVVTETPQDPMFSLIKNLKKDIEDVGLLQSIENILSRKMSSLYINTMKAIVDPSSLNMAEKRSVLSLKNAIFLYRNNFNIEDGPLTNVSLEASKFSALSKFINKDAGIKNVIAEKHGAVKFKELEALVAAHSERGDEFFSKFVEKNVQLYHSLRNTALEKILHQITVVHGKVKNIEVPETAKNSVQYHEAIRRLDDIVSADQVTKMALIEEQKFDFDFLSTILLVWRTVTSKPTEAPVMARPTTPLQVVPVRQVPRPLTPLQVVPVRQVPRPLTPLQVVPIRQTPRHLIPPRQTAGQIIQVRPAPVKVVRQIQPPPGRAQNSLKLAEENVDNPGAVSGEDAIIILDEDVKPAGRTLVLHGTNSGPAAGVHPKPVATVPPLPPPRVIPPAEKAQSNTRLATASNPMQIINGQGELPIRTKCGKCNDRTSENMEQLIHHYSVMHFREDIESDYIRSEKCPGCPETFQTRTELVKHIGYTHGTVQLVLTNTERWICHFCKKEFLSNDFLKKHLIKTHLEQKFESTFLALSEKNEILCQFCDKEFSHKKNLFCHIGIDHNRLQDFLGQEKKEGQNDIKCRHCDLEASLHALKSHYISTHYRDTFRTHCRDLGLLGSDHSCKFCLITFDEESALVEHLGLEHNLIYKLIANFQGKLVSATYRQNQSLKNLAGMAEQQQQSDCRKEPGVAEPEPEPVDPLLTETVFVDTSNIISPVKSVIKIISPSKLMMPSKNNNETTGAKLNPANIQAAPAKESPAKKVPPLSSVETNPLFQEYKNFCVKSASNPRIQKILLTSFRTFDETVFEHFLEYFCGTKTNFHKIEELLEVFSDIYKEDAIGKLSFVSKFRSLPEYYSYCRTVRTTPEECNPMQLVIFLSQVLAKPGVSVSDLPWLIQKINIVHKKVEGKAIIRNKKITDFFEAIDQKLADDIEEMDNSISRETGTKKTLEGQKTVEKEKETVDDVIDKEYANNSTTSSSSSDESQKPKKAESEPTRAEDSPKNPQPRVDVQRLDDSQLSGLNAPSPVSSPPALSEPVVKVEKSEEPSRQEKSWTAEAEVIELDDDDEEEEVLAGLDYKYFCLECEGCAGNPRCPHTDHPRVPIPFDLRSHFKTTGHVAVSPMGSFASMKKLNDIAYSSTYGAAVRKQWKDLVLAGSHKPTPFSTVKKCKWINCYEIFDDAVDAFKHIRDAHLKSVQSKQKKRKSETSLSEPAQKSSKL